MANTYILRIFRGSPGNQYWEEFELPWSPTMNVIAALMEVRKNPVNRAGKKVDPVVWEAGCLEEICGSCSMLINGKPRQACSALIDNLMKETGTNVITLAPFTKFPLVRDLIVDRTVMFDRLKQVQAWVDADSSLDKGAGPRISQAAQEVMYSLSKCMTCGCCVEACPQSNERSPFVGPQVIGQTRLFNIHPVSGLKKGERTHQMMKKGGISDCGNAQNCQKVCPKEVPLLEAIAATGRDATLQLFKDVFKSN